LWPYIKDPKTKLVHVLSTGLRRNEVAPATQAGMKPCTTGLFDGPLEMAKQLQNFFVLDI